MKIPYRKEIDGLRAVAVLSFIFFHAGFGLFEGGFVGVDVFLVISGFLIASTIVCDLENGSFSIIEFYERRVRRIAPALLLMLTVCSLFALGTRWLLPDELTSYSRALLSLSYFFSNVYFLHYSDYFKPAAEYHPLLHTWSLSLEEQFYALFPILAVVIWKSGRRGFFFVASSLALISLGSAQWSSKVTPEAAFYLLPTRMWELLIGVCIAILPRNQNQTAGPLPRLLSLTGLLMILCSIALFDSHMSFPSLFTVLPVLGTALVILFTTPQTPVFTLLSATPLRQIGLMSYSAYLWHQPILAFAKQRIPGKLNLSTLAVLGIATFIVSYLSWQYVERPFRQPKRFSRRFVFSSAGIAVTLLGIFGWWLSNQNGLPNRLTDAQMEVYNYTRYDARPLYRRGLCFLDLNQRATDFSRSCAETASSDSIAVVWGDSHSAPLWLGLKSVIPNTVQYSASGCPPIADANVRPRSRCLEVNTFVLDEISRLKPSRVFVHANWIHFRHYHPPKMLAKTIRTIKTASPHSEIIIIGGVPQWIPSLPVALIQNGLSLDREHQLPTSHFDALSLADAELRATAAREHATFISLLDELCSGPICLATLKNAGKFEPIAWDYGHMTEPGAILVAKKIAQRLGAYR